MDGSVHVEGPVDGGPDGGGDLGSGGPVPDRILDPIWCDIRGVRVDVSECVNSCAVPEHRPVCWLGRMYRDEPLEGGGEG